MAVTVTVIPQGTGQRSLRTWKTEGLVIAQVDLTMTANADYVAPSANFNTASGIDIGAIAAKMGFRKVFAILVHSIRNLSGANGVQGHFPVVAQFDSLTDSLRFFGESSVTSGAFVEVTAGVSTNFAPTTNNVLVSMLVFGV